MKHRPINDLFNVDRLTKTDYDRSEIFISALKRVFVLGIILVLLISFGITVYTFKVLSELPDIFILDSYGPDQSTQIFDKNNNLVANIHADEDRVSVPLNKIAPCLRWAVISIEDNRFYRHSGVDLMGTVRALYNNMLHKDSMQGGSTLTQQLVKNSLLTPQRSVKRKLLEAILAAKVELFYSKKEILEKYLNRIYWGNYSYGIEKASRKYFDKTAKNLNLSEASLLAGLIRAPELYSPYTNMSEAKKRQKIVLEKMYKYGYITKVQRDKGYAGPIKLVARKFSYGKYVYFVDYVAYTLRQKYGDNIVRRGGLKVFTTLDPKVQEIAEKTINEGVKTIPKGSGIKEGALVSIDVKTGYIQALVGGVDFAKSQYNRAILARRPVGSGFKPVVYLTGIRTGVISPDSIIYDSPVAYRTKWNVWCPHNWDGKYMGKMTIKQALTLSRNTPTVRIALKVGVDKIIETARLLGIKSYIRHGFSMVLGSSEITPLEVATVYSTLARDGVYIEPTAIRYIKDSKGSTLENVKNNPVRVVSSEFVRQLNSILVNVVEKGTGKDAKLKGRQVAGKTGTTDSVKDIWFNGFTPDTATVVWMGNDENIALHGVFSSNCTVLWNKFSTEYYKIRKIPAKTFPLASFDKKKQEDAKQKETKKEDKSEDKEKIDKQEDTYTKPVKVRSSYKKSRANNYKNSYKSKNKAENKNKKPEKNVEKPDYIQEENITPPPRNYFPDENNYENRYPQRPEQNNTEEYPQQNNNTQ